METEIDAVGVLAELGWVGGWRCHCTAGAVCTKKVTVQPSLERRSRVSCTGARGRAAWQRGHRRRPAPEAGRPALGTRRVISPLISVPTSTRVYHRAARHVCVCALNIYISLKYSWQNVLGA